MTTTAVPLPVAALLRRARNARSAKDRHDTSYFAWEASVLLGVAARPPADLSRLERPTVGAWCTSFAAGEQRVHRVLRAVAHADQGGAVDEVAPDHRLCQRHVEIDAQRRRRVAPRARGERLGVEHQPVHVENDRGGAADGTR